jgi:hypothetical protein
MTTVIYGLAQNCGACGYFKANLEQMVTTMYESLGVTVEKRTAQTVGEGFSASDPKYGFMSEIAFYPCIILVKTAHLNAYRNGSNKEEIFSKLSVWNGMVLPRGQGRKRIVSINPGPYGITDKDFRRFYDNFEAANGGTPRIPVAAAHSKSQSTYSRPAREPLVRNTQKMHRCGGIRPVPIVKK